MIGYGGCFRVFNQLKRCGPDHNMKIDSLYNRREVFDYPTYVEPHGPPTREQVVEEIARNLVRGRNGGWSVNPYVSPIPNGLRPEDFYP